MNKKLLLVLFLSISVFHIGNSQNLNTQNAQKFTNEVYKNTEYAGPKYVEFNKSLIARTSIKVLDIEPKDSYKLLSSVRIMDKYNHLERDNASNFDPNNFNPLKYDFNYYSKDNKVVIYRVDDSNYYIFIIPKAK